MNSLLWKKPFVFHSVWRNHCCSCVEVSKFDSSFLELSSYLQRLHHRPVSISYLSFPIINFTFTLSDITVSRSWVVSFFYGCFLEFCPSLMVVKPIIDLLWSWWVFCFNFMMIHWHYPRSCQTAAHHLCFRLQVARHHLLPPPFQPQSLFRGDA